MAPEDGENSKESEPFAFLMEKLPRPKFIGMRSTALGKKK